MYIPKSFLLLAATAFCLAVCAVSQEYDYADVFDVSYFDFDQVGTTTTTVAPKHKNITPILMKKLLLKKTLTLAILKKKAMLKPLLLLPLAIIAPKAKIVGKLLGVKAKVAAVAVSPKVKLAAKKAAPAIAAGAAAAAGLAKAAMGAGAIAAGTAAKVMGLSALPEMGLLPFMKDEFMMPMPVDKVPKGSMGFMNGEIEGEPEVEPLNAELDLLSDSINSFISMVP